MSAVSSAVFASQATTTEKTPRHLWKINGQGEMQFIYDNNVFHLTGGTLSLGSIAPLGSGNLWLAGGTFLPTAASLTFTNPLQLSGLPTIGGTAANAPGEGIKIANSEFNVHTAGVFETLTDTMDTPAESAKPSPPSPGSRRTSLRRLTATASRCRPAWDGPLGRQPHDHGRLPADDLAARHAAGLVAKGPAPRPLVPERPLRIVQTSLPAKPKT